MGALVVSKKTDDELFCTSAFAGSRAAKKIDINIISNKRLEYLIYKLLGLNIFKIEFSV
jgi:hypothetical protein